MSWLDRLQAGSYTASDNARLTFDFEDVSQQFTNQGTAFNFPNGTTTYVQRSGHTGRQFPIKAIFHGSNYDLQADSFMRLLRVRGIGKLQHPIYGTINVVPLGDISRSDALKSAAETAVIDVTFLETSNLIFPTVQDDPTSRVVFEMENYYRQGSEQFERTLDVSTVSKKAAFQNKYLNSLKAAKAKLTSVISASARLLTRFKNIEDSIVYSINDLIGEPIVLARQTMNYLMLPGYSPSSTLDRFSAYRDLIHSVVSQVPGTGNDLTNGSLYGQTYVGGCVMSAVESEFETQQDALNAAVFILDMFDLVNDWREAYLDEFGMVDTGGTYEALQNAVAIAAGFLIQISFSLKHELRITLTKPRSVVELVFELYGGLDDYYDFFINSNNLNGNEIIELPVGTVIKYYTQ